MTKNDFFYEVHEVVKLIPKGKVTSYGAIGNYLGIKRSARMVGWALHQAHLQPNVPAHRVVNRTGQLTGKQHFPTPNHMQQLLEKEGIIIRNNQIVHFEKHFWNPATELL